MIHILQRKQATPKKTEIYLGSNLQVQEIHYNKILKMQRVNNFKIVLQELVKSSKKS
jgi:hypothetical protein